MPERVLADRCWRRTPSTRGRRAFTDNVTSLRVSEKLGYLPDGNETVERRGERATIRRLVLARSRWVELSKQWPEVTIEGLEPALWMFGLGDPPGDG